MEKTDPSPGSSGPEGSGLGEPRAGVKSVLGDIRKGFLKEGQQNYRLKDEKMTQKTKFMLVRNHHRSHFTDEELMLIKIKVLAQGHRGRKGQSTSDPSLPVLPFSIRTNLNVSQHMASCLSLLWSYWPMGSKHKGRVRLGDVSALLLLRVGHGGLRSSIHLGP